MKIWRFHEIGPIENLRLDEVPVPQPGPGEALVRVRFAALNPADRYLVNGQYPRAGKPPLAVGRDGSGIIEQVGEGSRFKVGDPVVLLRSEVGVRRDGTLAEMVAVPEESLAPLPEGWSFEEGAAGGLVLLTAWQALVTEGNVRPGDTVLITGASGGVGTAALQLAKALGARVVALSRSEAKRRALEAMGADLTFDSEDPDLVRHVQAGLGGGRADVVVETLGGPYLQKSILMTGLKGRVCVVGLLAGLKSEIEIGTFLFKRIRIIGVAMGSQSPAESQESWSEIVETLRRSGARPPVDAAYPPEQVQEAFAHLARGPLGKVLVGPWSGHPG